MTAANIDPKTGNILRQAYKAVIQCLTNFGGMLDEPYKAQFESCKTGFDQALTALPADEPAVPAEAVAQVQSLATLLNSTNLFCSILGEKVNAMNQSVATQLASGIEAEITKRIGEGKLFSADGLQVKVGEAVTAAKAGLIPTTEAEQLCSAAREAGITLGKEQKQQEFDAQSAAKTVIETRKTALQTASIPLPFDQIEKLLSGTDAEFTARRDKASTRLAELQEMGVAYNTGDAVWGKVWLEDAAYEDFKTVSKAAFAGREDVDPFAGGGRTKAKVPVGMIA